MQIPILQRYSSSQNCHEEDNLSKTQIYGSKSTLGDSFSYCTSQVSSTATQLNNIKLYSSAASYKSSSASQEKIIDEKNLCIEHFKKYNYSCITCNQNICADCLCNPAKHRGHRFQRYNEKKEDWKPKYVEISAKINFKKNQCSQNIKNIQNIQQGKNKQEQQKIQKLQNHMKNIKQSKIDIPFKLENQHSNYKQICNNYNHFYDSCLTQLKSSTKVGLVLNKGVLIKQKINEKIKQVQQLQIITSQTQMDNQLKPNYYTNIFTLKNFSKMRQEKKQIILQNFNAYQSLWRLKVYPAGYDGVKFDQKYKGIQYMSLYVERLDGILQQSSYVIQIEFTSRTDPRLRIKKQYQSQYMRNQSWGYDRFTRVSNIYDHGFLGLDDTLFIKVNITPANYFQANRALTKVINDKSFIVEQNQRKLKILKSMLQKKILDQALEQSKRAQLQQVISSKYSQSIPQNIEEVNQQNLEQKTQQKVQQKIQEKIQQKAQQKIIVQDIPTAQSQTQTKKLQQISQNNIKLVDIQKQPQTIKIQEHKLNPESQRFKFGINSRLKQQIKSKLDTRTGILSVIRSRTTHYPQISLQKSPGKLIRLVSLKNIELMENSRKLLFNKSASII